MADDRRSIFKSLMHPKFIFSKPNDSSDKSKCKSPVDAHARRRQQVRRAQINHRLKKEHYISALESEVTRLRERVSQQQNLTELQAENQALRELLAAHGIACPPPTTSPSITRDCIQVSLVGEPGRRQHLEPSLVQDVAAQDQLTQPFPPTEAGSVVMYAPLSFQTTGNTPDMNREAFDFVMRLEQPCLAHTHPQGGSPQAPGHTLTLQSASFAYAPPNSGPGSSWTVPVDEMKQLLELSAMLPLSGELTPIQAWSHLVRHPGASSLTREMLQELTSRLLEKVQCYGFGAVIDESVFWEVFDRFIR